MVEIARSRRAHEGLQFRKGQFDWIEVGTVGREKAEPRTDGFDRRLHLGLFVHREVVEDDHIAWPERRHEDLLDIGEKRRVVDGPIKDGGRREAVDAQARNHCVGLPMATRRVIAQAHAARTAPIAAQEIGGDAGLVDEDVGARVVQRLRVLPAATRRGDIRPALFVGVYGFF